MTDRILDLSECPARLRVRFAQLVIERENLPETSLPLVDVAVVLAAHPQVSYTQAVLAGLAESGGAFVACNHQHLPVGMFLPLQAHHRQTQRFAAQAKAAVPLRKRLWRQIVCAKIAAQAKTLQSLFGQDFGLRALIPQVRSGDTSNVEARAARRYWPQLFADSRFRRAPDVEDQNIPLNYGYGVLRAIVARAICAAGLHPSVGIHHHNRSNPYCLADDLMEPFRPIVDRAVAELCAQQDVVGELDRAAKQHLISALTVRYELDAARRTLFDTVGRLAASLADAFEGRGDRLELPEP